MHESVNQRLSEYVDGELSAEECPNVEAHLRSCDQCRRDVDALRAVVARARMVRDVPPVSDLWPGILARISRTAREGGAAISKRFSFTLPQLVAAGLALMVLSGGIVWVTRLGGARTDFPPVAADEPMRPVIFDQTLPVRQGARLSLDNDSGEVLIRAWERDEVRVQARHAPNVRISMRAVESGVDISSPARPGTGFADFQIDVPRWMPVTVRTQSGHISVEGTDGEVIAESFGGAIHVRQAEQRPTPGPRE